MDRFCEIVEYKHGIYQEEVLMLTPKMLILLGAFVELCHYNSLPIRITSITESVSKRISNTHSTGRAVDVGIHGWTKMEAETLCDIMNEKYKDIAAISKKTGKPTACVYGDKDHLDHIHLQVSRENLWMKN